VIIAAASTNPPPPFTSPDDEPTSTSTHIHPTHTTTAPCRKEKSRAAADCGAGGVEEAVVEVNAALHALAMVVGQAALGVQAAV